MKRTIFHKVWSKVLGVEEFESEIGFSKFWVRLYHKKFFCKKNTFFEKNFFANHLISQIFFAKTSLFHKKKISLKKKYFFTKNFFLLKKTTFLQKTFFCYKIYFFYKKNSLLKKIFFLQKSFVVKIELKISKNRFQIRIPRPLKPLVKLYKKSFFS